MQLPLASSRSASVAVPLVHRILAAYRLHGEPRQIAALSLLAELTLLGAPTETTIRSWARIGSLLSACATSLALAGQHERAARFATLARQSHDLWETSLADICERRAVRVPTVIDAVCREVA